MNTDPASFVRLKIELRLVGLRAALISWSADFYREIRRTARVAFGISGMSFAQYKIPSFRFLCWFRAMFGRRNNLMEFDIELTSHTLEHRGCGIRAASYEIRPQSWLPEACVWLQTEDGHRKIWVHSFAHCFAAEEVTFPSRVDADSWALGAAKAIIDRALEKPQLAGQRHSGRRAPRLSRVLGLARSSMFNLRRFHRDRSRH